MADPAPPVILLAFARSEDPRFQGLPRLPEEARLLRETLEPAEAAGQIKLEIRQDATLDDILRAFDRFRDRVAIFHFAGHTDDESLLAEKLLGAEALLAAVHAQAELKLVFLNACENQVQAAGLHAAGVPVAIVTSEEVKDDLCPPFAMRFYRALAGGFTLAEAFDKARLAAEGEAYEQSGKFEHGPWLLSTLDPAAGAWRLPPARPRRSGPMPLQKPLRTQHFTGREQELAKLLENLQPGKIVTLCGPGGIGKSALAAEAIWTLAPGGEPPARFPDGIIFHSFYHQPQANLALEKIALAYELDPRPTPRDAALQALASKTALLVLDGAEEADDLPAVLAVAANCAALITTRKHEDAADDFQDIEPLPHVESVQLLRSWAHKYAADDQAANEIVWLLGGLPLALFLAGRYLAQKKQQASEYVAWLHDEGMAALHFGQRPTRSIPLLMQASLAAVSESAQGAFGVAGILALAPFNADAVAAALEMKPNAATRALGELVDYGLLLRPDDSYQVTHALAHSYGRIYTAPTADIIGRIALYYAAIAKTESAKGLAGYNALDNQRAHILAAQAAALKAEQWDAVQDIANNLQDYLAIRGYWIDRVSVLQVSLDAARSEGNRCAEIVLLEALGKAYKNLGETRHAVELSLQALMTMHEIGDYRAEWAVLVGLGLDYLVLGESLRAIECHEQALTIVRALGDRGGEGTVLHSQALVYAALGEIHRAIELQKQELMIAREIGDRREEGKALGSLGYTYLAMGEIHRAVEFHEQELMIAREIGDRSKEGAALDSLGFAYKNMGDTRHAIEHYEQALVIEREIGDRNREGDLLISLGLAYSAHGDTHHPIRLYEHALEIKRDIGDRSGEGKTLMSLGSAHIAQGDTRQAIKHYEQALVIEREIGDRRGEVIALGHLGTAYLAFGETHYAIMHFGQALVIAREIADRRDEGSALANLGAAHLLLGEAQSAIELCEQALVIACEIGNRNGEGFALSTLGDAYANLGESYRAIELYEQAIAILEAIRSPSETTVRKHLAHLRSELSDPVTELLRRWPSVRAAVIAACQDSTNAAAQMRAVLAYWEEMPDLSGLAAVTRRLLNGERSDAALLDGLDDTDAGFIASVLKALE